MGVLDWFDKFIDRRVEGALLDKSQKIDEEFEGFRNKITATTERLDRLSKKGVDIEQALFELSGAIPVKENIDTIMLSTEWLRRAYWNCAESTLRKTREYSSETYDWNEKSFTLEISPNKKFCARVSNGLGICIKAVKFIEGEGYGKYEIFRNGIKDMFFLKRKEGNEDGALFINQLIFFQEHDIMEIKQVQGKGLLKAELLMIVAGDKARLMSSNYLELGNW